ncbi:MULTISPECIES: hypothetical protein [Rhizobium/Agrobacterium group]|uniref:hypothetical protein n=1 Tax=Rhizobium/Agrobacterium group TaxID=227290 RepID=UPI0008DBF17F|nr:MULTISPECIES: hypothetical protein [Rhizobium/Agrobacterium group]MCF1434944.1 hypothetical protein [Allorhizobium ampelinum]MCF1483744.1 hypothetical protein [Allorhizobium ampelinum]MUO91525.1 hypothetical protein [Agrobacterium vitis]MUZ55050.1 hypothetical protein [Agrobacterium vitis]MUZ94383.1 hypothetical protein [Agrobacterium vitis]
MMTLVSSRSIGAALALLVLAALVFALLPFSRHTPSGPSERPAEQQLRAPSGSNSTFGGALSQPRPDVRTSAPSAADAAPSAWPGFVPRSSGLYTPPAGGN